MKNRIKQLRRNRGIGQTVLALEIGVTQQTLSNYEHDIGLIKADILKKLAQYFDVTTDYLLGISAVKKNTEELMKTDNTLEEYYNFLEAYKELDKYDREMVWMIIQTRKKTNINIKDVVRRKVRNAEHSNL